LANEVVLAPQASSLKPQADFIGERREVLDTPVPLTIHRPLTTPKGQVVLLPGWSGTRCGPADLLVLLATRLAQNGWEALRLDLPGRGDAGGEFQATDLDSMISAAAQAVDAHAKAPLVLLGICSGANVALGVASLLKPQASSPKPSVGVIAFSALPFQATRTAGFDRRRRWANLRNYAKKALSPSTWSRLLRGEINIDRVKKNVSVAEKPADGERNLKDSSRDIERDLLDWKGPALFIWGSGDEEAAPSRAHFEKLHAKGMGSTNQTTFHTIEGANHNFYSLAWREELCQRVLAFVSGQS
jgi:pimeloyl-ACP methyl ester carboxylesterase